MENEFVQPVEGETKKPWESKELWASLLAALYAVCRLFGWEPPVGADTLISILYPVAMIILRVFSTKAKIALR